MTESLGPNKESGPNWGVKNRSNAYYLQQSDQSVPQTDEWLTAEEIDSSSRFKFPKRHHDWRLGRWTAKNALSKLYRLWGKQLRLQDFSIRNKINGAPLAWPGIDCSFSLSHSQSTGFCAIDAKGYRIGCDVEKIEDRAESFIKDFFSKDEQDWVYQAGPGLRPLLNSLIWSSKESVLKLLELGLNLDTRKVIILRSGITGPSRSWSELTAYCLDSRQYYFGFWKADSQLVYTIVTERPGEPPTNLQIFP